MPLNPPAKRRRLESAASTLSKPFKSPLRKPPSQDTQLSSTITTSDVDSKTASTSTSQVSNNGTEFLNSASPNSMKGDELSSSTPTSTPNPPTAATTITTTPTPNNTATPIPAYRTPKRTPLHRKPKQADPELTALQSHHRALTTRLNTLRSELDTLHQAVRIESSSKDTELESLIAKWRLVSQDAADEVFVGAKDRVGRMGGLSAWREKEKERRAGEFEVKWEEVENQGWFGERIGSEDEFEPKKQEAKVVMNEEEGKGKGGEEEEFTMDFMLKTLNIDPKIIGFDLVGQRWIR